MTAELALKWDAIVGEGPVWDYRINQLYWVDILRGQLHKFDPESARNVTYEIGQFVGTAIPRETGGLILAMHHGWAFYDEQEQKLFTISDPEEDKPLNRFNDGKVDTKGRLWSGTMQMDPKDPAGSLYSLDTDLNVRQQLTNIYISNGLAWSPDDQWFYYIDSLKHTIACYRFDSERGEIEYQRDLIRIDSESGLPDGMTIDTQGNLWVAIYNGGKVICVDSVKGKIIEQIDVPAKKTSCCTFGGKDLDTLYITTISEDTDPKLDPLAGSLFKIKPGVKGAKANFFKG